MVDDLLPDLDLTGELSDGAIESLAALLVALADDETQISPALTPALVDHP